MQTGNQLKGYLQNETKKHNIHSNYAYNYYFTRALLERLFTYGEKFILKGSYSQFATIKKLNRPITDIDISTSYPFYRTEGFLRDVTNPAGDIKFRINGKFLTENGTLNYKIVGDFDGKNKGISLDIHKEEVLTESVISLPTWFSKDKEFDVRSISIEEHLANKIRAILYGLKHSNENTKDFRRFKDLYDVSFILNNSSVDLSVTKEILNFFLKQDDFISSYTLMGNLFDDQFIKSNQSVWDKEKEKLQFFDDISFKDAKNETNDLLSKMR